MLSEHFHCILKIMKQIIDASPCNCVLSLNSQKHNNVFRIFKYSQTQGVIFGVVMQSQEMGLMILAGPF